MYKMDNGSLETVTPETYYFIRLVDSIDEPVENCMPLIYKTREQLVKELCSREDEIKGWLDKGLKIIIGESAEIV